MSDPKLPPQQYKQSSRKGKKAWRKNVDITEVQTGLEQLREEIIQGGPISEKPSAELFALDTTGSEAIRTTYQKRHKPLKVDEILSQRSAVPPVDSRKRSSTIARVTDGIFETSGKRRKKDWVSKKELQRLKEVIKDGRSQLSTDQLANDESGTFDLWMDEKKSISETSKPLDFLKEPKPKVAPPTLRAAPVAMTVSGKPVRAVRMPKAGASYNPSFNDWDDLLTEEGEKEIEAEKKRRREAVAEVERQARIEAVAAAVDQEAARGRSDDDSAWEGFESGYDSSTNADGLRKKRPQRKTQAQRNKINKRKEEMRREKHEKRMGDRRKQGADIEATRKAVKRAGNEAVIPVEDDQELSSDSGDDTRLRRKRLGPTTIPDKSLEVVLPDELQESLRRLKPEGNLLNDRFRHLLVNGKVEARKPIIQPKKARKTYTEKWTYKDFTIEV